uniref:Uncharacterized protein n=1 Tax=Medicago truncatula TaxID=3880 RepID=A2Q2U9_MEDTR|nr:hypothetical protein MtrDRAFT_AC152185g15v2 [Medicago truncatula]
MSGLGIRESALIEDEWCCFWICLIKGFVLISGPSVVGAACFDRFGFRMGLFV